MSAVKKLEEKFGEKPIVEMVYQDENAKVVRFYLRNGQEVKPHTSPSSVFITVLKGKLAFVSGKQGEDEILCAGDTIFYEPKELHGFKALEDSVVEAVITPRPDKMKVSLE